MFGLGLASLHMRDKRYFATELLLARPNDERASNLATFLVGERPQGLPKRGADVRPDYQRARLPINLAKKETAN